MSDLKSTAPEFRGILVSRLSEVFDLVQPVGNWKMPISTTVSKSQATAEEVEAAVIFYCGGTPDIADEGESLRVTGAGYYVWVGA